MSLPNDTARCGGQNCPSALNCRRYVERGSSDYVTHAAFWMRREAGASACENVIWVNVVTTYGGEE